MQAVFTVENRFDQLPVELKAIMFDALPDFLDPRHPALTVEGLPAPRRAIFIAESL